MLKRSKLLIAFLVVTVICASVGFAAIQDVLDVNGTVDLAESEANTILNDNVKFTAITGAEEGKITAALDSTDTSNDTIKIDILSANWTAINQEETFTATIASTLPNQSVNYTVAVDGTPVGNGTIVQGCFAITVDAASGTIAANSTSNVVITVKLVKVPEVALSDVEFGVTVTATPAN